MVETLKNLPKQIQELAAQTNEEGLTIINEVEGESGKGNQEGSKQNSNIINKGLQFYSPQVQFGRAHSTSSDIFEQRRDSAPYVIGICGGPSSGKSTVAQIIQQKIKETTKEEPVILSLTDFYLPPRGLMKKKSVSGEESKDVELIQQEIHDINMKYDFDNPSSIDWELLRKAIDLLKGLKPFNQPIYDEKLKVRKEETKRVRPSNIIIIEGHLLFNDQELMDKMDLKVFIDTDDDIRLSRRVLKMNKDHEDLISLTDMIYKYQTTVKPSFEKYIEPSKKYADIIVPNYGFSIDVSIDPESMILPIPAVDLIIKQAQSKRQQRRNQFF